MRTIAKQPLAGYLLLFSLVAAVSVSAIEATPRIIRYDRDVRPILSENCFACHGFDTESRQADLRLDTREGAIEQSGVIVPHDPASSSFLEHIMSTEVDLMMPPADSGKRLNDQQKETLRQWIEQGAEYETHWAFVPPVRLVPPTIEGVNHPIDRFIQWRLAENNLSASETAGLSTLIRRVSLDLIGLPPTPKEIDEFEAASAVDSEAAYQSLVERLLASPHYGERWGRWWLDQARYGDSNGYSIDAPREIWKYRDWVIASLNDDMPFDQFTIEQFAGDLLLDASDQQRIATGFHRNTQINQEGGIDHEQFRIDSVFDRVATTGTVWLGLTIGCAQCHDHKFDPLTQKDFYRLFAFLNNQDEPTIKVYPADIDEELLGDELKELEVQLTKLITEYAIAQKTWDQELTVDDVKKLPNEVQKAMKITPDKRSLTQGLAILSASDVLPDNNPAIEWLDRREEIIKKLDSVPTTMVLKERSQPRKTSILIKGDFTRPSEEVTPGTPAVLPPLRTDATAPTRLDLSRWIVDRENPLTARVIVNRIWQQYFGRGIVETDNDFGLQGTSPIHPQLLDWLSVDLMDKRWSLKQLHRLIVTSHTYRQSSVERAELRQLDPLNLLLGRQNRLRLDAEIVRDVALRASDLLSTKLGGPPVYPPIPEGVMAQGQVKHAWNISKGDDRYRRGLYTFVYRGTPPPSLNVFDAPDGLSSCTRRIRSNTPLQALTLLNDAAFFEFASALQKTIDQDGLATAFRRCTSRRPTDEELELLGRLDSLNAARAILNLDETISRE